MEERRVEAEGKAAERMGDVVVVEEELQGKQRRGEDERSKWRKRSAVTAFSLVAKVS